MKTNRNHEAAARRKKYEEIRMGEQCVCGGFKWRGNAFCRACTNRLPPSLRAALFTCGPLTWPDAYETAKTCLEAKGGNHGG